MSAPAKPRITKADVEEAFRGQRVEERPDGSFRVYLANGKFLTVRRVDDLGKLSREAAERSVGKLTDKEWANFRVHGAFTITWSDGRRTSSYGLIRLVNGAADSRTLRHEMLHAARSLGLVTEAEWRALVEKYAPESTTDGHAEERIAAAFEAWQGLEGLWRRLTTAINRVLSSLGAVNPSADTAFARLREGKVWSREARPETNAEARRRMAGDVRDGRGDTRDLEAQAGDSHRQAGERTWDTSIDGGDPKADGVRYSGRIDRSRQEAVARLAASKPIAVSVDRSTPLTGDARRNAIREIAARLEARYADHPLVNEPSGRQIVVDLAGLKRFGDLSVERTRWSLIHSIDELLHGATPITREPRTGTGKSGREITAEHALGNVVEIDGDTYVVKHMLEEDADGRLHYAGTTIRKSGAASEAGKSGQSIPSESPKKTVTDASLEFAVRKSLENQSRRKRVSNPTSKIEPKTDAMPTSESSAGTEIGAVDTALTAETPYANESASGIEAEGPSEWKKGDPRPTGPASGEPITRSTESPFADKYGNRTIVNSRGETVYPDGAKLKNWKGEDVIVPKNHIMSRRDPPMDAPPIVRQGGLSDPHGYTDAEREGFLEGNDGGTFVTPHHRHQLAIRDGGVFDELPRIGYPEDDGHLSGRPPRHPNDGRNGRNRSAFSGIEGERLHRQEVARYFVAKGKRLVYDQTIGLWIDPQAKKE